MPQTASLTERLRNLREFVALTKITIPTVIDNDDNTVKDAYAAWPDRLYAVDREGRIAYKGRPGPFGFRVPELEDWLRENAR